MTTNPIANITCPTLLRRLRPCARLLTLAVALVVGDALALPVVETNAPVLLPSKPNWLTELSLGFRESYDNNVFLSGVSGRYLPANYTIPPGGVAALKNQYSSITAVSPRIGFDFAPLVGAPDVLQSLTLGYAPDFTTYHDAQSESYDVHRLTTGLKLMCDDLSLNVNNAFCYVDGSKIGPSYPGSSLYSSFVNDQAVRERREQTQDRASVALQYDQKVWFVRGVGSLVNFNMLTEYRNTTTYSGYLNYPDRYDANVGGDIGYKLTTNCAVTVGYRIGEQHQDVLPTSIDSKSYGQTSSSDYQRLLLGLEGSPLNWLTARFQAGPDFRQYSDAAPVRHKSPVTYYGEGSLDANLTSVDILSFKYRQWRWVSSTGKVPYDSSSYELSYLHKLTDQFSLSFGARAMRSDYHCGLSYSAGHSTPTTAPTNPRDDWDYIGTVGLRYAITANLITDLGYSASMGRNADGTVVDGTRNFNDQIVSLGVTLKY